MSGFQSEPSPSANQNAWGSSAPAIGTDSNSANVLPPGVQLACGPVCPVAPAGPPILLPPQAIPGTPANKALTDATMAGLGALGRVLNPTDQSIPHGNSLDSQRQTFLYQLTDIYTGEVLKYGITSQPVPERRYTSDFYAATYSRMDVIGSFSNRGFARAAELGLTGAYFVTNGQLSPLSSVP